MSRRSFVARGGMDETYPAESVFTNKLIMAKFCPTVKRGMTDNKDPVINGNTTRIVSVKPVVELLALFSYCPSQ